MAEAVVAEGGGPGGASGVRVCGENADRIPPTGHMSSPPACLRVTSAADESRCKQICGFQPPAKCVTILFRQGGEN